MDELSKFPYSVWLLRVLYFSYYHKTSTAVYPVPRYFVTVNTVDEILSTAHPYTDACVPAVSLIRAKNIKHNKSSGIILIP